MPGSETSDTLQEIDAPPELLAILAELIPADSWAQYFADPQNGDFYEARDWICEKLQRNEGLSASSSQLANALAARIRDLGPPLQPARPSRGIMVARAMSASRLAKACARTLINDWAKPPESPEGSWTDAAAAEQQPECIELHHELPQQSTQR
jgi:hypothetical protein